MPTDITKPGDVLPGDLFEDCRYHPCLCVDANDPEDLDGIYGISLIDGTPSGCSILHCALRKLSIEEAVRWKSHGPRDRAVDDQWWDGGTISN